MLAYVDKNNELYMDSQPQEGGFNIEPCTPCDKNRKSHIETGVGK
jgi:hypothetical protein